MTEHKAHSSIKKVTYFFLFFFGKRGANEKENNINNYYFNFELYVTYKITN